MGIDARGFVFGAAVAYQLGVGFIPVRKKGKLPYQTNEESYTLEYGEAAVAMHVDAITRGNGLFWWTIFWRQEALRRLPHG